MKPYEALCQGCEVATVCDTYKALAMAQGVLRLVRTGSVAEADIESVTNLDPEEISAVRVCLQNRRAYHCNSGLE